MTDREICEQIVKDRSCTNTPLCRNCPLNGGRWDCGDSRVEMVEAAKRWLEDHSPCTWSQDEDGLWHTDCGQMHEFMYGSPLENGYMYCPFCDKKLEEGA